MCNAYVYKVIQNIQLAESALLKEGVHTEQVLGDYIDQASYRQILFRLDHYATKPTE